MQSFRPSEINGCQVQHVSYLNEIDDAEVLDALQKLRNRSSAAPNQSSRSRSAVLQTRNGLDQFAPPNAANITPDSSVASSAGSVGPEPPNRTKETAKATLDWLQRVLKIQRDNPTDSESRFWLGSASKPKEESKPEDENSKVPWDWLGNAFADFHCAPFRGEAGGAEFVERFTCRCENAEADDASQKHSVLFSGKNKDDQESIAKETPDGIKNKGRKKKLNIPSHVLRFMHEAGQLILDKGFGSDDTVELELDETFEGTLEGTYEGTFEGTYEGTFDATVDDTIDDTVDDTVDETVDETFGETFDDTVSTQDSGDDSTTVEAPDDELEHDRSITSEKPGDGQGLAFKTSRTSNTANLRAGSQSIEDLEVACASAAKS